MNGGKVSGLLAVVTVLVTVAYAGNGLYGGSQAAELPETVATTPETTAATEPGMTESALPEPLPTVSEVETALAEAMAGMDGVYIFVYDAQRLQMLCSKTDTTDKLYPASVTKLYTAWLALQHLEPDTVVTAGEELGMVGSGSSLAYISRGCRLTVDMLVEAMLLPSGNDAAYVLAAAAGRAMAGETLSADQAVQRFVAEMNAEAERQGFVNSHFTNPDGYHTGAHYSCPEDIMRIAGLVLDNEIICRYTALEADSVTYASGEKITWYNTNRMVNRGTEQYQPDCVGLKTGYTGEAGYCLLAAFDDGENRILVGIFGAEKNYPRYENASALWQCCR